MAIATAICTSFLQEILVATHDFTATTGDAFKIALFTASATLGAATATYSTTNEASGTGYAAGGETLTNVTPTTSGTTAFCDFNDVVWSASSISADGALIYNSSNSDKAVSTHSFGSTKVSSSGDFTVGFPVADATNAIIRIAS